MTEPNDVSKAIKVLMDASLQFRAAMERAARTLADAMEKLNTPEMRKAVESAAAKGAAIEQATRRRS